MSDSNVFGPIITAKMVRKKVQENVETWMPDYLAEVGENDGRARNALPQFRSYQPAVNLDKLEVENQTPSCIIVAPGTISGKIRKRPKGVDASWAVGIAAVCSGPDQDVTYELAELYGAALLALMVQHPGMNGFAAGTTLLSARTELLDANGARTLAAGMCQFAIDVYRIVDPSQGPVTPSVDTTLEPGDWPIITTVEETVLPGVDGI